MKKPKTISAEELDRKFDDGEDVSEYVDWSTVRHVNKEARRINVDFPEWMIKAMDKEADRLGIPRQAVIKIAVDGYLSNQHRA